MPECQHFDEISTHPIVEVVPNTAQIDAADLIETDIRNKGPDTGLGHDQIEHSL